VTGPALPEPPVLPSPPDEPAVDAPSADTPAAAAAAETLAVAAASPRASLLRSSLTISSMTLISRFLGFARDLAISYTMGASASIAADAWNTALAFPNMFRRIFAEGAFSSAFVPAYTRSLRQDGEEVADVLAADAMATLAAATIVLTLIAQLTMPWLMYVISPGFAADPAKFKLAVVLTQITMPYLPCMAIYAHLSGVLNARGRFVIAAAAPMLLNIGTLVTVLPQHSTRAAAFAASWGVIGAGIAQAGLLWWGVRKSGARVDLRWPRLTPEIRKLIGLAVPAALAQSAFQINIFISGILASGVQGARSWLATADRLYQLPLGLVGVAIGIALLPRLSSAVHGGDRTDAQDAMDEALSLALAFTLPAAVALVAMPYFLIDALFVRGMFHAVDADATARALFHYGWGVPAFVLLRIVNQAFYARQDTRTPMRFALVQVGVNVVLGVGLFHLVGFEGIAAATSIACWLNVVLMMVTLWQRDVYRPSPATLARLTKMLIASVVMGAALALASHFRSAYEPRLWRKEIAVAVVTGLGAALYVALLFGLRAVTPADIRQALKRSPKAPRREDDDADLP
jgi:putative peptidoglycan lipid II flippase